ncbi:helix-turn-helix domain-containing protein [Pseudonocardia dioxanivorans]|jgi:transcriptional regulator with XRE-family HTH domain|uniref:Helix-turn-helix domain protein n=1 Tax=Pseudonocardia dioxanivorans (strain ATCC 55486 / DSM 44775 / JCM 13855 / CB1190) TaxID=675635 RepID=F4CXN7_PSEUX|nr:XRE family transcriptional regulator [Pseudonocardia dioxanivorans]AEA27620.1 helix-turn-helix domain protein [Pseudonocardia dioxanivorans CB1190]
MTADPTDQGAVLARVGPRLAELRRERDLTLAALSRTTGISTSTLSRLESGHRRATLELLLPIARAYGVGLDDLVGAEPSVPDPRVRGLEPIRTGSAVAYPLTRGPVQPRPYRLVYGPGLECTELRTHEGFEWVYVLSGRLTLLLGDKEIQLGVGEAAEFDCHVPHGFATGDRPVEALSLFGKQGERAHLRASGRRA